MPVKHRTLPQLTPQDARHFWSKVDIRNSDECWPWTAGRLSQNRIRTYGAITFRHLTYKAHRIAYILTYGKDPEAYDVLHRCDNPPCCNPNHLFLGTTLDNSRDMCAKGRQAKGDRHGTKVKPESIVRGDAHHMRQHPEMARGERNSRARLSQSQVLEIRHRHSKGETPTEMASEYGVSRETLYHVVNRYTWKHLP